MSKREVELFIFDIYIAIVKIEYVSNEFENIQDLLYDFKSWDTVIREFEIIGEASKYLIKDNLLEHKFQVVVDFRNLIIHEYFGIEPEEVDDIIKSDLKTFKVEIEALISKIDNELKKELLESFIEDNKHLDFILKELKKLESEKYK